MTLTLQHIRARIWKAAKQKSDLIAQAKTNIGFTDDYTALLREVQRLTRKPRKETDDSWKARYRSAHMAYQLRTHPAAIIDQQRMIPSLGDDAYLPTDYPDVTTGNGLNRMMINFLFWNGHRVTRQNVQGRLIEKNERQDSGVTLKTKKYIKSTTRTGTADLSSTIYGRSVQLEGKAGRDKPRPDQLREQAIERAAGGVYEFINTPGEFLTLYDELIKKFLPNATR